MDNPNHFDVFSHLERLLADFTSHKQTVCDLQTPNAEDDEFIRCGIAGFAQRLPLNHWGIEQFRYVQMIRNGVADDEFSPNWVRFACLAAGYFSALTIANDISKAELLYSASLTPGFMWLRYEAINGTPD